MPNRGRRTGFAKKIDTTHWTYGSFVFQAQAAGTAAVNLFSAQHLPETLLRLRGEWAVDIAGSQVDSRGVAISIGIIQVPEGTGTTVLWSPITDGDAPWIWWDTCFIGGEEAVTDVIGVQAMLGQQMVVDSKAMRKLRNTDVQCVIESTTIGSALSVDVFFQGRFLAGS